MEKQGHVAVNAARKAVLDDGKKEVKVLQPEPPA
jgi:hypothetical protein